MILFTLAVMRYDLSDNRHVGRPETCTFIDLCFVSLFVSFFLFNLHCITVSVFSRCFYPKLFKSEAENNQSMGLKSILGVATAKVQVLHEQVS